MGMYTEILISTEFKESTPDEVINTIKAMCGEEEHEHLLASKPARWRYLFMSGSFYTADNSCRIFTHNKYNWALLAKGDIKNYKDEIEQFIEFIKPWCTNDFIGYKRYEESREPEIIYSGYDEGDE